MIAEIQYLDDALLKGGLEFAALIFHTFLLGGLVWTICTLIARYTVRANWVRMTLILPFHLGIPLYLAYNIAIKSVYHEFEEFGQTFEHERFLDDSFPIFIFHLLLTIIPLYLLKFWRLKQKKIESSPPFAAK